MASVWRGRSAASAAPFPEPFATVHGEERFDADAVVAWLALTGRGNNPVVREDCAAFASPKGMSAQDDEIVFNGLAALLCLKEISDGWWSCRPSHCPNGCRVFISAALVARWG